jgi:hypothetical protein
LLEDTIGLIKDRRLIEQAVSAVLRKLEEDYMASGVAINDAIRFFSHLDKMRDAAEKCGAICRAYAFLRSQPTAAQEGFLTHLLDNLKITWDGIDVGWQNIRVAFAISSSLARTSLEEARRYLNLAETLKKEIDLQAAETAYGFIASVRLAVAALAGLLPRQFDNKEDVNRLETLISQVPSFGERALLWADVAMRYLREAEVDRFLSRSIKEHNGEKILYKVFTL